MKKEQREELVKSCVRLIEEATKFPTGNETDKPQVFVDYAPQVNWFTFWLHKHGWKFSSENGYEENVVRIEVYLGEEHLYETEREKLGLIEKKFDEFWSIISERENG